MIPEDVAEIFKCVCGHRLILSAKARLHEQTAEGLLEEILEHVDKPEMKESKIR